MSHNRKHGASSRPGVDVVIITGGRWDFLKQCLEALDKQTVPVNIILLDNASDSEERIQNSNLFDGISTKRIQQRLGFPAANNEAVRMGTAPIVLFLNDDCILNENAIEKILESMKDETIGVCGAKLIFPLSPTGQGRPAGKVQHVGMALNIRGEVVHPLLGWSPDNPKCKVSRDVFSVTGACFMTRRSLFNQVGGFDTSYGIGTYEEVQFCQQAKSLGKRVYVNCEATGYHYAGATAEKNKVAYPLQMNALTFRSRFMGSPFMTYDEYKFYD